MSTVSMQEFSKKWRDLSPKMRTAIALGALFGACSIVSSMLIHPGAHPRKRLAADEVSDLALPKPHNSTNEALDARQIALDKKLTDVEGQLKKSQDANNDLLKRIDDLQNQSSKAQSGVSADLAKEVMEMHSELDALKSAKSTSTPALSDPLPPVPGKGTASGGADAAQLATTGGGLDTDNAGTSGGSTSGIRVVGDDPASETAPAKDSAPTPYLPPGSMFEAITLNGMDAPTSQVGEKNPVPAVLRVKTDALLPNSYSYNIKECFVLVSGYGSLSSERAQLRTETISCVRDGGKALEAQVDGYVVGEDGRVGMRGRLVSKQGQFIAKSLAAGVLSGFGNALTPEQIPQLALGSGDGYISTQRATLGTIGETGVATGFAQASKSVSAFYLDMAKEMTPVVEIDAGRKVTIVLIKGVQLK